MSKTKYLQWMKKEFLGKERKKYKMEYRKNKLPWNTTLIEREIVRRFRNIAIPNLFLQWVLTIVSHKK